MNNEFYGQGTEGPNGYGYERWDSFTLEDEARAKARFSRFFLSVFVYLVISIVLILAVQIISIIALGTEEAEKLFGDAVFTLLLNAVVMYGLALPVLYLIIRKMRYVPRHKTKMPIKEFLCLLLIGEAAMYGGSLIGNYLSSFIGLLIGAENSNDTIEVITSAPIWLIIILAVIIGPIVEELIFRKLLMDRLGAYGDRIAIIVSAVAFALFHGNLYQLFYAFLIGIILAYVYSKTGNVVYPIIMHAIINFIGSVLPTMIMEHIDVMNEILPLLEGETLPDLTEYSQSIAIVGLYSVFIYSMLIAGVVLFFKKRRSFFISDRCEIFIPKEKRASTIMLNVGAILFIAFSAVRIISDIISPLITGLVGA